MVRSIILGCILIVSSHLKSFGQSYSIEISMVDSVKLDSTRSTFVRAVLENDKKLIKELSMDTILCRGCLTRNQQIRGGRSIKVPVNFFIKKIDNVFDERAKNRIKSQKYELVRMNFCEGYEIIYQIQGPREYPNGGHHEGISGFYRFGKINGKFKFDGYTTMP